MRRVSMSMLMKVNLSRDVEPDGFDTSRALTNCR
jgi:hypothetical protein